MLHWNRSTTPAGELGAGGFGVGATRAAVGTSCEHEVPRVTSARSASADAARQSVSDERMIICGVRESRLILPPSDGLSRATFVAQVLLPRWRGVPAPQVAEPGDPARQRAERAEGEPR